MLHARSQVKDELLISSYLAPQETVDKFIAIIDEANFH